MAETKNTISVDVVSDIMCPWCFIGKKNLDEAIKLSPDLEINVSWRPYQLDATLPIEGKDRKKYLSDKFGGVERANEIYQRINEAGTNVGIDFKFDAIEVSPNTINVHRLIHWAGEEDKTVQEKLVERLFEMFFLEGKNVGDFKILAEAAEHAGMDGKFVTEFLKSDKDVDLVKQQIAQAQQIGVTGVPFFIIDSKHGIPGAVPAEDLARAFKEIAAA